ncbi:transposase [Azospirillum lipoferum]|uniref:Transposase n=1 Tax=Azospirillum lipoferum TaxID=193 RepID=A0A5A9GNK8_AZOLI|nr:transposase [Azospirillum lipoferum]
MQFAATRAALVHARPLMIWHSVSPSSRLPAAAAECIPIEIAWVVERSFSWINRYRRLNNIVVRAKEHLAVFVEMPSSRSSSDA